MSQGQARGETGREPRPASNLLLRVLSAAVLLPVIIALVLWREPSGLALATLVTGALALREFLAMALPGRPAGERLVPLVLGLGFGAVLYLRPDAGLPASIGLVLAVLCAQVLLARTIEGAGARAGAAVLGVFYVVPLLVALPLLHRDVAHGSLWVLLALGATFSCDTGAYFLGRAIGRHKLAPVISPGKTREGVVGGVAGTFAFTFVARATFFPELTVPDAVVVALGASLLAPLGDLFESLIKRSAGVKDSGNLIPGHGGMLDRIDALLFVGGFVYLYAELLR